MACPNNDNHVYEITTELPKSVTVIRNGSVINANQSGINPLVDLDGGWLRAANVQGNYGTQYYSDKIACSGIPGIAPGKWIHPLVWESYCPDKGTRREVKLIELYTNSMGPGCNEFCNSLTDIGGNPRKPVSCGGTDPDIFTYNPGTVANDAVQGQVQEMQAESDATAADEIAAKRKKIFGVALIIFLLMALFYLFIW